MATTKSDTKPVTQPNLSAVSHPPLFYLGKVKAKKAKKLKKGSGPLMEDVNHAIEQARSRVAGSENHHPLVISYEEKPRKNGKKNKIKMFGMTINRKKLKRNMKKNLKKRGIGASFL